MRCFVIFSLGVLLSLLVGCIDEDQAACERTNLVFSYVGDGTEQLFSRKIGKVDLYVFNGDGQLVYTKVVEQPELLAYQGTRLRLDAGTYRVVCVGNAFAKTRIDVASMQELSKDIFAHPGYYDGSEITDNDSLYWASKIIRVPDNKWMKDTVDFAGAHVKLDIEVRGLGDDGHGGACAAVTVDGLMPFTDFTNCTGGTACCYHPMGTYDAGRFRMKVQMNVMRFMQTDPVTVNLVYPDGSVLYSVRLDEFLEDHPEIDLTKNEVLVPILIQFGSMGVVVSVPDWYIEDLRPAI